LPIRPDDEDSQRLSHASARASIRLDHNHQPISVKEFAFGLPAKAFRTIAWREGSAEQLSARFAQLRMHAADRDYNPTKSRPGE
jgi:hypothetical protein